MDVTLAALADYALSDKADKLSIIGMFGTIFAEKVPCVHSKMVLVVMIRASRADYGKERSLLIDIVDADGKRIADGIEGRIRIKSNPPVEPEIGTILELHGTTFPSFGTYRITIFIDGTEKKALDLRVLERPKGG